MLPEPLSIVHVTTFYPPHNFGGDGVQVQRLAEAQARRGHRVEVVHAPGAFAALNRGAARDWSVGERAESTSAVAVHALGGVRGALEPYLVHQTGRPVLSRAWLSARLGGTEGRAPDVIHFHNVSLVGGLGVLAMGQAVKLYTAHEYWLTCPTHLLFRYGREICHTPTCVRCTLRSGRPPQWWRSRRTLHTAVAHLDSIIYPSRLAQSVYAARGIDRPSVVLPHFVPDQYLASAAARGTRATNTPPFFLYVGRLDVIKGIEPLLSAIADEPSGPPVRIVGDGPLMERLRTRYGGQPRVQLLGRLAAEDIGPLYRDALALLLPSVGYEILGQVVLEAFAHGTPAIVTSVSGARELVEASAAGFVYEAGQPPHDHMTAVATSQRLRDNLGQKARAYVRDAHRESTYLDRYDDLVSALRDHD